MNECHEGKRCPYTVRPPCCDDMRDMQATIDDLEEELRAAERKIADLEEELRAAKRKIDDLKYEIKDYQEEIDLRNKEE